MASQSGVGARGERKDLNWTKNLRPLPKFTTEQIHNHVEGCGKKDIGSKGYKFFTESYIHDVYVGYEEGAGHATIKASCFRSQRKNEEPHKLSLKCGRGENGDAKVLETSCSCKAG